MEKLIKSTRRRFTFLLLVVLFGFAGRSFAMDRASDPTRNPEIHQEGQEYEFTDLLDGFASVLKEHFWPCLCAADLCRSVRPVCHRFNDLVGDIIESDEIPLIINHYDGLDLRERRNFLLCYWFLRFIRHVKPPFSFAKRSQTAAPVVAVAPVVAAPVVAALVVAAPAAAPALTLHVTNELEKTRFIFKLEYSFRKNLIRLIDRYFKRSGDYVATSSGYHLGPKKPDHNFCCPLFERNGIYRDQAIMGMDFAKLVEVIPYDEITILYIAMHYYCYQAVRRRQGS